MCSFKLKMYQNRFRPTGEAYNERSQDPLIGCGVDPSHPLPFDDF